MFLRRAITVYGCISNINVTVYLRFISPAIVSPEQIDIRIPQSDDTVGLRRGLMVIAKVVQNLANNIMFGKEPHMMVLNEFLLQHVAPVTKFVSGLQVRLVTLHFLYPIANLSLFRKTWRKRISWSCQISGLATLLTILTSLCFIDSSIRMLIKSAKNSSA